MALGRQKNDNRREKREKREKFCTVIHILFYCESLSFKNIIPNCCKKVPVSPVMASGREKSSRKVPVKFP